MKHTGRSTAHQAERFFYSRRRWIRQDVWGNQRCADEFDPVVFTDIPRHAKSDE